MNSSVKGYHRKPTYDELIQEAVINPTEKIKYPNRIATQLRNTAQLTRFDDESFLEMSTINSNAMKQTMQQTAVQRALQTPRPMPSGLEQFDTADTDESLQEQMDETEELLEEGRRVKRQREDYLHGIIENEANADQIDDIIQLGSSAAASSGYSRDTVRARTEEFEAQTTRNLRGTPAKGLVAGQGSGSGSGSGSASTQPSPPGQAIISQEAWARYRTGGPVTVVGPPSTTVPYTIRMGTASEASAAKASSASASASSASSGSRATTISALPRDIYVLLADAKRRRTELNATNAVNNSQLAMEISDLIYQINLLTNSKDYHKPVAGRAYIKAKKRLIEIMDMPL